MLHRPAQVLQFLKLLGYCQLPFDTLLAGINLFLQSGVFSPERFISGVKLTHLRLHPFYTGDVLLQQGFDLGAFLLGIEGVDLTQQTYSKNG